MLKLRNSAISAAMILVALALIACPVFAGNTALAVRVNNLSNEAAALMLIANGAEILGISNGFPIVFLGITLFFLPDRRKLASIFLVLGLIASAGGFALTGLINQSMTPRDTDTFQ